MEPIRLFSPEGNLTTVEERVLKYIIYEYGWVYENYDLAMLDVAYNKVWVNTKKRVPVRISRFTSTLSIVLTRLLFREVITFPSDDIELIYMGMDDLGQIPPRSFYDAPILYLNLRD